MIPRTRFLLVALVALLALAMAACDNSSDASTTSTSTGPDGSTATSSTTTSAPITELDPSDIPGTHSPSITDEADAMMREEIGVLILEAEESRALPFLSIPTVTILDDAEFQARVEEIIAGDLDPVEIAADEAFFRLLGMLDDDVDLGALLVDLYAEQVAGFYDPDAEEMVVPAAPDGFSPLQRITVFHELIHALTDQHFDYEDVVDERAETGNGDDLSAAIAVVEGDATYQQFLFLEAMDPLDAVNAALESLSIDTTVLDSVPGWMALDLTFPYEQGLIFMNEIIEDGGLNGVDLVYQDLPTTTEQILEPRKYLRREEPGPIDPLTVELAGWDVNEDASFGEWGVRLILNDTLTPGMVTQAASGWDNDTYRTLLNGDDIAVAWHYLAESEQDAEDLVNGLIAHARGPMGASSSRESGGGLLFEGGGTTVFIDRIDSEFYFIASTDATAVGNLRVQLGI